MQEVLFLITVDCDLRVSSVVTRNESLFALMDIFDKQHVSGHVTWFLNEHDFAMTHSHPEFLREAIQRGDTLGVHDHIDFMGGRWEYDAIYDFCSQSQARIRSWLGANGHSLSLSSHRYGCWFQHPEAYRVLVDLGYTISSDVVPSVRHVNHTQELSFDNRDIPVGILPYTHTPESINDYRTNSGPLLQIPILRATLTADNLWTRFNRDIVRDWIAGGQELGHGRAVICFHLHPYEVVNWAKLEVDPASLAWLGEIITIMRDEYAAQFCNVEAYAARFAEGIDGA